jgi:hypothetical protein
MAGAPDALRRLADHLEEQEHLEAELVKAKEAHRDNGSDKSKDDLQSVKEALRNHREQGRNEGLTLATLADLIGGNEGGAQIKVEEPVKSSAGVKPAGQKTKED